MKNIVIATFLVLLMHFNAFASESVAVDDAGFANELLKYGVELVRVELRQKEFIKGDLKNKHSIVVVKVKMTGNIDVGKAYNPWGTFKPFCITPESNSEKLHIGIVILNHLNAIKDILYEGNVSIKIDDAVKLDLVNGSEFSSLGTTTERVFTISSPGCNDRSIYWDGNRFSLVLDNQDFEELP